MKLDLTDLNVICECVLNRMDSKGETLEEAIEAVLGTGRGPLFNKVVKAMRGEK